MSLVRFSARNHPQQLALRGALDEVDDRRTPEELWEPTHREFGFTLDAAATAANAKLPRWCSDGLTESWKGERVWCNPPFSDMRRWVEKAWAEARTGCPLVVMLSPNNRCEQAWWQDLVEPMRDQEGSPLRVRFLRGRTRFTRPQWQKPQKGDRPPFGCCLLIWEAA